MSGMVLVAYDGSDSARAAIDAAAPFVKDRPVVVASAWLTVSAAVPIAALGVPVAIAREGAQRLDAVAREEATRLADEGSERARAAGMQAEPRVVGGLGAPWKALVEAADELEAALIVAGTRGRSPVAAAVLGSTAQGLLHRARRPVLVVPA